MSWMSAVIYLSYLSRNEGALQSPPSSKKIPYFGTWPFVQLVICIRPFFFLHSGHGVWKAQKKSHSTLRAKRATFTFWVDKSYSKMPKIVHFGEYLKTWSLRSGSVTRQVSFNSTKNGGKCQNSEILQMRHFEYFSNNVFDFLFQ